MQQGKVTAIMSDSVKEEKTELKPLLRPHKGEEKKLDETKDSQVSTPHDTSDTDTSDTADGILPVGENEICVADCSEGFVPALPSVVSRSPQLTAEDWTMPSSSVQADQTDNESNRYGGNKEPSYSFDNPAETERVVEATQSQDDTAAVGCFSYKSDWLAKKCNDLFFAVNYHETEKVKRILSEEEASNLVHLFTRRDKNGLPCIMKAIARLSLACLQPLLSVFASLDFESYGLDKMDALQSDDRRNLYHVAAQMVRDAEILNTIDIGNLMEQLADRSDNNGTTPLIVACRYQNPLMAQRLVKYKAKIDHVDKCGFSPIYWATASGSAETLKVFLALGHDVRNTEEQLDLFRDHKLYKGKGTILQAILESKCPETLQVCLESDSGKDDIIQCLKEELNVRSEAFLHAVCETPLVNLVKLVIDDCTDQVLTRLDESDDESTPLMRATEARQFEIVKLILCTSCGKKTLSWPKRSKKETALLIACRKGFREIVEFMMENSDKDMRVGHLDDRNRNIFHHAAKHDELLYLIIDICKRNDKYKDYKEHLNVHDKDGYAPLHHAASTGSYRNVEVLLASGVAYGTKSMRFERTALHYAACSNIFTVKVLVRFVKANCSVHETKQYLDAVDSRMQTSLHNAALLGKWQTVNFLLKNGAAIKCDTENETPLHFASYRGCTRTVRSLLQHNPAIVNCENRVGETAAMYAALNGQTQTLQILLDSKAELWAQGDSVERRKTCLDWAVVNKRPNTARAILEQDNWKQTMEKSSMGADGLLAKMVTLMPSIAIDVLDKCETKSEYKTEYDFFALQTKQEMQSCNTNANYVTSMKALEAMTTYSRDECLKHPVVQKFLDQKWSHRARKWYMFCFTIYTLFLLSFTAYITQITHESRSSHDSCVIVRVICYVFVITNVVKEFFQLLHQRFEYFCKVSTHLELMMYICVFIFLPNEKKSNVQRQAGAIAIFLAWINFTWFLKRFQNYGIYIIMAKKIFVTFIKVVLPVAFFIMAFSMTFFVLLHNDAGFENIARSFVTSFAMMVGEVDYRDTFLNQTGSNFVLILCFLVLFLVIMSILLMNLLTGLAVGDIGKIMKRSLTEKRIQQAILIVDIDKHVNKYPGLGATYVKPLTVLKKRDGRLMSCVEKLVNKIFPRLEIEEEKKSTKSEGCQCRQMKEQMTTMQGTLEELKRCLCETQAALSRRKRPDFRKARSYTCL